MKSIKNKSIHENSTNRDSINKKSIHLKRFAQSAGPTTVFYGSNSAAMMASVFLSFCFFLTTSERSWYLHIESACCAKVCI